MLTWCRDNWISGLYVRLKRIGGMGHFVAYVKGGGRFNSSAVRMRCV